MRDSLITLVSSPRWEQVIIAIIVLNAITLGLETIPAAMEAFGPVLIALDTLFLAIFTIEIALRLIAFGPRFFRDPWSIFDFSIVAIALMPATGAFSVLRALRILRILRLISVVPSLRRVVSGLISAMPGIGSIFLLLLLVFYVFAVMATKLYGATFPGWFGSLESSLFTLFQLMTMDSWSSVVRPVMEVHPHAWVFFIPYLGVTSFTVLNLFIGVIVSALQDQHDTEVIEDEAAAHAETTLILAEVRAMRAELAELRQKGAGQDGS